MNGNKCVKPQTGNWRRGMKKRKRQEPQKTRMKEKFEEISISLEP
jgi:hypothetical protein